MFTMFRNYTTCIWSDNLDAIEQTITYILEQEGCRRISQPPQPISNQELRHNSWLLLCDLWIVGLFVGAPGWTIVKTKPNELLCRRAKGANRPRLSELAMRLDKDAFHIGAYGNFESLLEADAFGYTFVSGEVDCPAAEKNRFYEEQINQRGYSQFCLLEVLEEIRAVVKAPSLEQEQKKEKRLAELKVLRAEGKSQSFDIQLETAQLLKSHSERMDDALEALLGGSHSYWYLKDDLFYLAYTQQQQLEADGVRLLYFQPAEHYRQLDPLYEIEGHY